jgi:hypothetical protein
MTLRAEACDTQICAEVTLPKDCSAIELMEALQFKRCMFGIPIERPTNVYCDNSSIVTISTKPAPTLKKFHDAITDRKVHILSKPLLGPCSFSICIALTLLLLYPKLIHLQQNSLCPD